MHLNLRLNQAKSLLTSTAVKHQRSSQTGFDALFYFSKLFKKKTGVSPKSLRLKSMGAEPGSKDEWIVPITVR